MAAIFISYAREDRDRAEMVARGLNERGWSVWWDRQIAGGAQFDRVTEQAIADAKIVIVLWSRHSIDSDWVRSEAVWALDHKKLLPVRIDPVHPPLRFSLVQTLDLDGIPQNPIRSPGFETLIREVARQLDTPAGRVRFRSEVDEVTSGIAKGSPKSAPLQKRTARPQSRSVAPPPPKIDTPWTQTWRLPVATLAAVAICLMFGFGYMIMMGDAPAVSKALGPARSEGLASVGSSPSIAIQPAASTSRMALPPAPAGMAPPLDQSRQ